MIKIKPTGNTVACANRTHSFTLFHDHCSTSFNVRSSIIYFLVPRDVNNLFLVTSGINKTFQDNISVAGSIYFILSSSQINCVRDGL